MKIFKPADLGVGLRLLATASYVPETVITNAELISRGAPLTEAEILKLTGIRARRWAAPHQATSDLALEAARTVLRRAQVEPAQVDRLVLGTVSPDHPSPATACSVQHALGLPHSPAMDVAAACAGFVFALDVVARAVATGDAVGLALAADIRSRYVNIHDRATCALFGDGAAATLVARGPVGEGLLAIGTLADGSGARSVYVPAGGSREPASLDTVRQHRHCLLMADGPQVYFQAVEGMLFTATELLKSTGLTMADVDLVVPHQPNRRLLDRLARVGDIPADRMFVNVEDFGNTSGAACGLALDQALRSGRVRAGGRVLLLTAGAGYAAGAALLRVDQALLDACARE